MEPLNVSPASSLQPYELLQKAADFFERLGVPYRIVGSMASMACGEARFTNDIDFLVDLNETQVEQIENEFPPPDYYVSGAAARESIRLRRQFNIIHVPSGLTLDIIQRKDTDFGRLDILHGQRLRSDGFYDAWFGSAENVILMKLRYFQEGASDKHLRDIASMLVIQGSALDRAYLAEWSTRLGVQSEWLLVSQQADNCS